MRVLVTGNRGGIGSVIEAELIEQGHSVVGFDIAGGDDIRDKQSVLDAARGCDAVIHLASILAGPDDDPDEAMEVSVMGTWHVLAAAKAEKMQRVVYFSSVNALGVFMGEAPPDYLPIDEKHPPRPTRAYGMSKHLVEVMCQHFTQGTGIGTICLRPPAVWFEETYAQVRRQQNEDPTSEWAPLWEYGAFCDVRDVAAAAILGLACPDPGHVALLLCADDIASDYPSREIAKKVLPDVPWVGGPEFDADPYRALVDNSLAKKVLGWQPQYRWRT